MMQRSEYNDNGFYFNAIRRLPYAALKVPEAPRRSRRGKGMPARSPNTSDVTISAGPQVRWTDRPWSPTVTAGPVLSPLSRSTDGLRVIKPADTGPAARAGVMAGDLITAIDDKSIKGLTLEAAFRRISGPVNAAIKLKIIRADAERSDRCRLCPGGGPLAQCRASSPCRGRQARRRGNRRLVNPRFRQGPADARGGSLEG